MNIYKSQIYLDDLRCAIKNSVDIEHLFNASIMITGATGLIGSFIVDVLLLCNKELNANVTIYALGRSKQRLEDRFHSAKTDKLFLVEHDVNIIPKFDFPVDFIIHAASNAYPAAFNADPVGTIMSNILGTKNMLDYALNHSAKRFLFLSSGEVYGQGDLSVDAFDEKYSGYVDPTSPRSCYPNSKRCAETLCVSYTKQYGLDTVIARPSHTYGANFTELDNRANVQFVNRAIKGDDIVLLSAGNQLRSYTYIADAVSAIFSVLSVGECGNAYNIANPDSITTIAGFAQEVAVQTGVKVVFSNPDEVAKAEMTPIAKQVLDATQIYGLGNKGMYRLIDGIKHTIAILKLLSV